MNPTVFDMESIARQYYAGVYRFCARRVGNDHAADAAQETFLTAQRVLKTFRGESSLSTWLFGIANNECRRLSRKRNLEISGLEEEMTSKSSPTEPQLVNRELLNQAMGQLSKDHREAVLLHEVDGLTYEEAAAVLGVPVGTVKSRLHHAFKQLRATLFAQEFSPGEAAI